MLLLNNMRVFMPCTDISLTSVKFFVPLVNGDPWWTMTLVTDWWITQQDNRLLAYVTRILLIISWSVMMWDPQLIEPCFRESLTLLRNLGQRCDNVVALPRQLRIKLLLLRFVNVRIPKFWSLIIWKSELYITKFYFKMSRDFWNPIH